jgi:hypothetical protein
MRKDARWRGEGNGNGPCAPASTGPTGGSIGSNPPPPSGTWIGARRKRCAGFARWAELQIAPSPHKAARPLGSVRLTESSDA